MAIPKIIDVKLSLLRINSPTINNIIKQIIEFVIDILFVTNGLNWVLDVNLSMSRSNKSLIMQPADLITIDPKKKRVIK